MSALLDTLTAAGITLTVNGDKLRYAAPAGAMTPALRQQIAEQKPELLAELANNATPEHLAAGAVPLWLFDAVHSVLPTIPPPSNLTADEITAAIAQSHAAYEAEVKWWRDHPPAVRERAPWRPNAPCHRCNRFDWYVDDAGKWRCGCCTPRPEGEPS